MVLQTGIESANTVFKQQLKELIKTQERRKSDIRRFGIQVLFIVLKVAEVIDCSWGWLLFPAWCGLIVLVVLLMFSNILNKG